LSEHDVYVADDFANPAGGNLVQNGRMRFLLPLFALAVGVLLGATLFKESAKTPRATTQRQDRSAPGETRPAAAGETLPSYAAPSPEIDALLERARRPALPEGTGRITGTVRTEKGEPVAGIRLVARPTDHPSRPKPRRRYDQHAPSKPPDLDAIALDAIERTLWNEAVRVVTHTDARGEYELTGLLDAKYSIRGSDRSWEFRPVDYKKARGATDGMVIDFTARRVTTVAVTVLNPDGTEAERARIICKQGRSRSTRSWTPRRPEIRLPVDGGTWEVYAESYLYGAELPRSKPVQIEAQPGVEPAPILLRLIGATGLRVTVAMPEGLKRDGLRFRMRRLAAGEKAEPGSLAKANDIKRGNLNRAGECVWTKLEPGRYLVGAGWCREFYQPLAHAVVEVTTGMAACNLDVGRPTGPGIRTVRVRGPDGALLTSDIGLLRTLERKGSPIHRGLGWIRKENGDMLAHLRPAEFEGEGTHFLQAYDSKLGQVRVAFDPTSRAPIEIRYQESFELVVVILGWGETGLEGGLSASIETTGLKNSAPVGADGMARFKRAQPGRYRIRLIHSTRGDKGQWGQWRILETEVDVTAKNAYVELRLPRLFALRVHCPNYKPGTRITIMRTDKSQFMYAAPLPEDRIIEIENVPPGKFSATGPGRATRQQFEVNGDTDFTMK